MIHVDAESFLVITIAALIAALTVVLLPRQIVPPVVVLEVLLGILIGPDALGLAHLDEFTQFFGTLGLGLLFFFAGYEIDFERLRGNPLRLGVLGWVLSLVLAYSGAGLMSVTGLIASVLFTGSALATTAIGTLIPILRDAGDMRTKLGTYLLAAGAMGEFGPILLVTILLSGHAPLHEASLLIGFIAVATVLAVLSIRSAERGWRMVEEGLESSGQPGVRILVVLVFGLVTLAASLGLDVLLGGFVAGIITRVTLRGREVEVLESKLTAVGYGFLIPFFFITSGMAFDLSALLGSTEALLEVPAYLGLFLVARGVPALVLYRSVLDRGERAALGVYSATALPLVVAITTLAVDGGHMNTEHAASLVGAAILSTLIYPFLGLAIRRRAAGAATTAATA